MGTPRGVLAFVERLEGRMADLLSEETRVILAYSGGLASTLVAMVARKRCNLVCVVAGAEDSAAVRAAEAAKAHLDYRVQFVQPDIEGTCRIRDRISAGNAQISATAVRTLIPLRMVLEELPNQTILAGFGPRTLDAKIGTILKDWGVLCPLLDLARSQPLPRSLLRGDGAVGKTSLIRRFVVDKFSDEYITTIGTKVTKKDLRIESPGKITDLTFMIWDVLGQKGYKGIQESSFQGAKGALLMYDVTRLETAESLQNYWIPHLLVVTNPIPLVVVGNKVDLADSRRQAQEELDDLKEALGVTGFLSSAKTGQNVEAGFLALAKAIIAQSDAKMSRREAVEEATHEFIAVTDQIIMDFCDGMGGQEAAMPIVRQQLTRAGVDVKAPTREGLRLAVDYLAETESSFRNAADVEASKRKRLGWIKEVA